MFWRLNLEGRKLFLETKILEMPNLLKNPEDWELWSITTQALLKRKGCFAAVSNPKVASPEQIERAYGFIVEQVHDELLPVVARHVDC